jgi:hypothetical protein
VTLEGNTFNHSTCDGCSGVPAGWHYYGLVAGITGAGQDGVINGWTIRSNFFENPVGFNTVRSSVVCGNSGAGPASWEVAC